MRNLLLAPVLASLALTTLRPADACGPYVPQPKVLRLSTHSVHDFTHSKWTTKSFVMLPEEVPDAEHQAWRLLAPSTYDNTQIANAPALAQAMDVTLVGPSGTRVVSSKKRVYLSNTFEQHTPTAALEIEVKRGEFAIALAGKQTNVSWFGVDRDLPAREVKATAADADWVKAHGVALLDPSYIYISKLAGTELEAVSVLPKDGGMKTFIRSGNDLYAQFAGSPVGGLTIKGMRYVLAQNEGVITPIWL